MPYNRDSSDSDEPAPKTRSNKELKKRIEGFGNSPMPPPVSESPADVLWGSLGGDQSWSSWYDSARTSVNDMLDAIDDTVNAVADTVDDAIAAVIGEDDEPYPDPEPPRRRQGNRRTDEEGDEDAPRDGEKKKKKKKEKEDTGERSDVDWSQVVTDICVEGDLEEFVLFVRSQIRNEFEEKEVGGLLADQLLNEVKADAILRVLHVMQAVVSDENLPHAADFIRTRCATKLGKLQATSCYAKLAKEVQGEKKEGDQEKGDTNGATPKAEAKSKSPAKEAPTSNTTDLLDMAPPTNGSSSASTPAKTKAKEPEDLIGLGAPAGQPAAAAPLLPPPPGAAAKPAFKRGDRVRALWAGDGKRYPALVESVKGQTVTVQWIRRHAAAGPSEAFVADVGDDSTHENVQVADVQLVSAARSLPQGSATAAPSAAKSGLGDLLDFDAPATKAEPSLFDSISPPAPAPAAPADLGLFSTPTTSTPTANGSNVGSFNATFPAFGSGGAPWPNGNNAIQAPVNSWPAPAPAPTPYPMGSMGLNGGTGSMRPAASPSMMAGSPASSFGSPIGGYPGAASPGTLAGGASYGASYKAPMKAAAPPASSPPGKKEIQLDDAFALTAAFKVSS